MKSMQELRDEEAATYAEDPLNYWESAEDKFKAGWDARDNIDNEALSVAVDALEFYCEEHEPGYGPSWTERDMKIREALDKICELIGIS